MRDSEIVIINNYLNHTLYNQVIINPFPKIQHWTIDMRTIEYDVLLQRHVSQLRQQKNQSDTPGIALLMDVKTFFNLEYGIVYWFHNETCWDFKQQNDVPRRVGRSTLELAFASSILF